MKFDDISLTVEEFDDCFSYEEMKDEEIRRRKEHITQQMSYSPADRLRIFNKCSLLSKEDVIQDIKQELTEFEDQIKKSTGDKLIFLQSWHKFLSYFIRQINHTVLFNRLEPGWAYRYILSSRGAILELMHVDYLNITVNSEDDIVYSPDTTFTVIQCNAKAMSIEEYAEYSGKTEASLRQALRRGKYRSAFKMGQEWRISELCEPPVERGYKRGVYKWDTSLIGVPKEFEYIKEPGYVYIDQDDDDKQVFTIYVNNQNQSGNRFHELTKIEAERLERFLIAHPMAIYIDDEKIFDRRRKTYE